MLHSIFAMGPTPEGQGGGGMASTLIMFGAIFAIFYFMIIRPQNKKAKDREKMLGELQKGDKVITGSGIHGVVNSIDEGTVIVQVSDNVKLKFERSAIATIMPSKKDTSSEK